MEYLRIKNWKIYQHYSDRTPPWIKLYNTLLDDYEFCQLDNDSKLCLMLLWLLASRSTKFHDDGDPLLPNDETYLSSKIGIGKRLPIKNLISSGFLVMYQDDSTPLAKCLSREEKRRDRDRDREEKIPRFAPPTLEEVSQYCQSRNNTVDPVKFHAHYTANGWRVGKNAMRDWRAAIVTWERRA